MIESPIHTVVRYINKSIVDAFPDVPVKMYGLSETIRKRINENIIVFFPSEIGVPDKAPIVPSDDSFISGYHKVGTFTMTQVPNTSYGRKAMRTQAVFAMSLFVFMNTDKMKATADSVMFTTSAAINLASGRSVNFELMSVQPSGGTIGSTEVLSQEYRLESNPFQLNWQMFRLNYNITVRYDSDCFTICK